MSTTVTLSTKHNKGGNLKTAVRGIPWPGLGEMAITRSLPWERSSLPVSNFRSPCPFYILEWRRERWPTADRSEYLFCCHKAEGSTECLQPLKRGISVVSLCLSNSCVETTIVLSRDYAFEGSKAPRSLRERCLFVSLFQLSRSNATMPYGVCHEWVFCLILSFELAAGSPTFDTPSFPSTCQLAKLGQRWVS